MATDPNTLPDESYSFTWDYLDLWSLEAHVEMLKRELPRVIEEERKRIWEGVRSGDEQAEHDAGDAEMYLDEGDTTRILTGTALIAIWATYESVVNRCARRIQRARKLRLRLRDIKGDTFLDQADKYFDGVLGFKLHIDETTPERLEILYGLRNALAHANGQLEDVKDHLRPQVTKWVSTLQGLKEFSGNIIVSIEFVERALDIVKKALEDLSTRTEAEVQRIKAAPGAGSATMP